MDIEKLKKWLYEHAEYNAQEAKVAEEKMKYRLGRRDAFAEVASILEETGE